MTPSELLEQVAEAMWAAEHDGGGHYSWHEYTTYEEQERYLRLAEVALRMVTEKS